VIVSFIDEHKGRWGIEPTCRVLTQGVGIAIAPGTYYAYKNRPTSARAYRDAKIKEYLVMIHAHPRKKVYGIRKLHAEPTGPT